MADKIKKLSDAIRLGATFRPQGFGFILSSDGKNTCALGAAADALGLLETHLSYCGGLTEEGWNIMKSRFPDAECKLFAITNMNDKQGMTRETIADWLEAQGL
jgi:hypothetical protein